MEMGYNTQRNNGFYVKPYGCYDRSKMKTNKENMIKNWGVVRYTSIWSFL